MTNIEKALKNSSVVKEVPKTKRGNLRHTWKPILDYAIGKGIIRLSEDDVSIQSALTGLNKEAKLQKLNVALNTRKIDGKMYLYIQVKK